MLLTAETVVTGRPDRVLAPADLKRLSERSDVQGFARYTIHWLLIAAGAALVAWTRGTWWVLPAMFLQGWFLIALFAPVHESVHFTAFKSRRLNVVLGWIASVPTLDRRTSSFGIASRSMRPTCLDRALDRL